MKTLSVTWSGNYFLINDDVWICHPCLGIWIDFICHSFALEKGIEMETWNIFSLNEADSEIYVTSLMEPKSLSSLCGCPSLCQRTGCCCLSCWMMTNLQILASSLVVEIPLALRAAQVSPQPLNLKVTCGHFHGMNFWAHLMTLSPWTSLEDL